jgi:plasmid stabilization system protein ParE
MASDLVITDEAQQDVEDAIHWYEEQQEKLGIRFYLHVEQVLDKIAEHPHHYAFIRDQYRCVSLNTFPYQIIFTVKADGLILVLAVWHTSLDPRNLYKRLQ